MKVAPRDGDRFAQRPDANVAAVLVYGPDRGRARERAELLLKAWKVDAGDPFGLVELGEDEVKSDAARLADELRAMTLTGGPRAVRLRASGDAIATTMKTVIEELDTGALEPAAFLLVEAGELTGRSKLRAAFEGSKRAAALACYEDDAKSLGALLDEMLAADGLSITPDGRARLLPHLEGDRMLARAEIAKIVLYKGPGASEPVTAEDVDAIAAGAEPVALDDVVDAVLGGDMEAADRAVALAVSAGVSAVGMTRAIQRRLYQLHAAQETYRRGRDAEAAAKTLRPPLFGPRRNAFKAQLNVWAGPRLDGAIAETLRTELRQKSASASDAATISRLALALAGQARRARR